MENNKPIRVLHVVTIMNRGGLETNIMNYYRKIDRNKIQFDFITHRNERGDYDDEIEELGGKIYKMIPIRPGNYKKYFNMLDAFFAKNNDYKIVHSHINENSAFVLRAAKKANIECRIAHNHVAGLKFDYKFIFRMYARLNLKNNVNNFFACSKDAAKWLFGNNIFNEHEVNILNNAIDIEKFSFNNRIRETKRKELGLKDELVFGHVGRFSKSKNHDFLIDVFYEINKNNKNTILLLVGDGELKPDIKKKVNKLGIEKYVKFLGLRTDVSEILQAMDGIIFPSFFEALPVCLVEAQATGLKCVVSTGIPKDANIINNMEFLDLKLGAKAWAENILTMDFSRNYKPQIVKSKGYDINDNVKWLTDFYLKNS